MHLPGAAFDGDPDAAEVSLLVSLLCVVAILYTFVAFHRIVSHHFVPALYILQVGAGRGERGERERGVCG
jgi:hypothetical protein